MYGDLLLDQLGVKFLGPVPLDLELVHLLSTFPCGADEHYVHPRGKHGCAVKFHFSGSEQNVLPRVLGIQGAVPHNTVTYTTTQ